MVIVMRINGNCGDGDNDDDDDDDNDDDDEDDDGHLRFLFTTSKMLSKKTYKYKGLKAECVRFVIIVADPKLVCTRQLGKWDTAKRWVVKFLKMGKLVFKNRNLFFKW